MTDGLYQTTDDYTFPICRLPFVVGRFAYNRYFQRITSNAARLKAAVAIM
jgi:hypothetical protein